MKKKLIPHLEAWPKSLLPQPAGDIARLDRMMFEGDEPSELADRWWWIVRDRGAAVAFAGMKSCKLECNQGMILLTRAGVIPSHRGRGIHQALIAARVRYAKRQGYLQALAYVKNKNMASCNALIRCGFKLYQPETNYAGEALYFHKLLNR